MQIGAWQVQIHGWLSDLEHLARHFTATAGRVVKDGRADGYLYESDAFLDCQTSESVLTVASEELRVLSGVMKLVRESPEPLRAGAVYRVNANGGRDAFVHVVETARATAEVGVVSVTVTDSVENIVVQPSTTPRTVDADRKRTHLRR